MRLVDADKLFPDVMKVDGSMAISQGQLAHAKTVEAIPKADYETRLADMYDKDTVLWMFRELQLEIDEVAHYRTNDDPTLVVDMSKVNEIIQQKIDALKGGEDENNN